MFVLDQDEAGVSLDLHDIALFFWQVDRIELVLDNHDESLFGIGLKLLLLDKDEILVAVGVEKNDIRKG